MTVHEQHVASRAVEAERLAVDATVMKRPRAARRTAEWGRAVIDHPHIGIAKFRAERAGDSLGNGGLGPAPRRAESSCFETDRVDKLGGVIGFAATHVLHDRDGLAQPVADVGHFAAAQLQSAYSQRRTSRQAN